MKLKEFLQESMTSADAAGFIGASGQGIDRAMSGPFYPSETDLLSVIKKQNIDTMVKQKFSNLYTPVLAQIFAEVDWDYKYDEPGEAYSMKNLVYDDSGLDNSKKFNDKWKNDDTKDQKKKEKNIKVLKLLLKYMDMLDKDNF